MLDDYGLPSYSSRRSSYNYTFSDQLPHPSNGYQDHRKLSTTSTATKTLDLPATPSPTNPFSRPSSSGSFTSDQFLDGNRTSCCSKKVRNAIATAVLLFGAVLFVVGLCMLVFSNDDPHNDKIVLSPLGYFFLTLGILIVLLTLSIVFLPSPRRHLSKTKQYHASAPLHRLNPAQLPQTLSSMQIEQLAQSSAAEAEHSNWAPPPKITITKESDVQKVGPSKLSNYGYTEHAHKYGESSKQTSF